MTRRSAEPIAVAAVIAASVVIVLVAPRALRIPFATLFLLVLPGYFATLALFPRGSIDRARRALLSLALSIALVVLVALLLHLTFELRSATWVAALAVLEFATYLIARERIGWRPSSKLSPWRVRARDALLLAVALAVLAAAVTLARTPLHAAHVQGYTALWIVPARHGAAVRVVVASGELKTLAYRLIVFNGGRRIQTQTLPSVAPGTQVARVVTLPQRSRGPISAVLYRDDQPRSPYRSVSLTLPRKPSLR
jgi:hypothetical protein